MRKNLFKGIVFGTLAVTTALFTACMGDNSAATGKDASLTLSMGLKDVRKDGGLSKSSAIQLSRLVVTLTSSATVPEVLRDTIEVGENGFLAIATVDQTVSKTYNIKPLRNWTITVKTLDANDSVIHADQDTIINVKVGQSRDVTLNLASKFVMYVANFKLPDSLRASGSDQAQKLNINRLMMVVDGDTVVDSTQTYFAAGNPGHKIAFDYVKVGVNHDVALFVFADLPGWPANKPVFGDTITITPSADTTLVPSLPWTGPGSPSDPDYDPANPGGAKTPLTINISKVNTVTIEPGLDSLLFKRK